MSAQRNHVTVFYAMKGGSGTTVTAAIAALANRDETLIVDLAGDMADVLGRNVGPPTLDDYLLDPSLADTPLDGLTVRVDATTRLLPASRPIDLVSANAEQLGAFVAWFDEQPAAVVVDAGTGVPHLDLAGRADQTIVVTRACYVSLIKAARTGFTPDGVVDVREPNRSLGPSDVERSFNAPIVATVDHEQEIARLVDAGLLVDRAPQLTTALRRLVDAPAASGLDRWRAAQPERNSPDVDYGMSWTSGRHPDRTWRVSWNSGSGDLYAVDDLDQEVVDLGHFATQSDADAAIKDWAYLHRGPRGFDELCTRISQRPDCSGPSLA
ncbi:MAG: hypothetical protein AAFP84_14310 [Actinomycetota bacterium]